MAHARATPKAKQRRSGHCHNNAGQVACLHSHVPSKGGTVTVLDERHVPVVEVRVSLLVVGEKALEWGRSGPEIGGPQAGPTSAQTEVFVVAPTPSFKMNDPATIVASYKFTGTTQHQTHTHTHWICLRTQWKESVKLQTQHRLHRCFHFSTFIYAFLCLTACLCYRSNCTELIHFDSICLHQWCWIEPVWSRFDLWNRVYKRSVYHTTIGSIQLDLIRIPQSEVVSSESKQFDSIRT